MSQNLIDEKSILVQVMAWCHQTTSHYLSQCWPRSMLPHGITRPQWVKEIRYILSISCEIALRWMPEDSIDGKSASIQVVAWRHQLTSLYLNRCWPSYMKLYGITRLQWVNSLANGRFGCHFKDVIFKHIQWLTSVEFTVKLPSGECHTVWSVWYKTKFGNHLCMATKIGGQC